MTNALFALFLATLFVASFATNCTTDTGCDASEYCQICDTTGTCAPRSTRGQSCGGFVRCSTACVTGLSCQYSAIPEGGSMVSDMPGRCCEAVECPACPSGMATIRTIDASGCLTACTCETANMASDARCPANAHWNDCPRVCAAATCNATQTDFCGIFRCTAGCECNSGYGMENGACVMCSSSGESTTASWMAGGFQTITVDASVQAVAECAMAKINAASNSIYLQVMSRIVTAEMQVVAGANYRFILEVGDSNCLSTATDTTNCQLSNNAVLSQYEITVFMGLGVAANQCELRSGPTLVTATTAAPTTASSMLGGSQPGGFSPVPIDATVQAVAECAMTKINAASNSIYLQVMSRIVSAGMQVVAGANYRFILEVGDSNCLSTATDTTNCQLSNNAVLSQYEITVFRGLGVPASQCALRSGPTLVIATTVSATSAQALLGATMPGGFSPVTVDATVQAAAACAMTKINAASNSVYLQALSSIDMAGKQIVAGINYHFVLSVGDSNCLSTATDISNCQVNSNAALTQYAITVYVALGNTAAQCSLVDGPTMVTLATTTAAPVLIGGYTTQDVNSALIQAILPCAMAKLNQASNGIYLQVLSTVVSAATQVVNGVNYKLVLEVGDSSCLSTTTDISNCQLSATAPNLRQYQVIVNVAGSDAVSACALLQQPILVVTSSTAAPGLLGQGSTTSTANPSLPGGFTPMDATSTAAQNLATCAMAQLNQASNSMYLQVMSRIVSAQMQIVAGANYRFILEVGDSNCLSTATDTTNCQLSATAPNLRQYQITVFVGLGQTYSQCTMAGQPTLITSTSSSSTASSASTSAPVLIGGYTAQPVASPRVYGAAVCALSQLNQASNSAYLQVMTRVVSAATQVVNGVNYKLVIEVGDSTCMNTGSAVVDTSSCQLRASASLNQYQIVVHVAAGQPLSSCVMSGTPALQTTSPQATPSTPVAPGGTVQQYPSSPMIQNVAACAMAQLNQASNSLYLQVMTQVVSAATQVVAGVNYFLVLEVGDSTCLNSVTDISNCQLSATAPNLRQYQIAVMVAFNKNASQCTVTNPPVLVTTTSAPATTSSSSSQQQQLLGGFTSQNISDPMIQNIASCAIVRLNQMSNSMYLQVLVKIESAATQVVAGTNYKLVIEVADSTCLSSATDISSCQANSVNPNYREYEVDLYLAPAQAFGSCTMNGSPTLLSGSSDTETTSSSSSSSGSSRSSAVLAGVLCGVLAIILVVVFAIFYRHNKKGKSTLRAYDFSNPVYGHDEDAVIVHEHVLME